MFQGIIPDPFSFVLLSLFVWRLSSLLVEEDGPPIGKSGGETVYLFDWFRYKVGVRYEAGIPFASGWSSLFICVWCVSVWVSLFVSISWVLFPSLRTTLLVLSLPFAMSAVAVMVERLVSNGKG